MCYHGYLLHLIMNDGETERGDDVLLSSMIEVLRLKMAEFINECLAFVREYIFCLPCILF